MRTGTCVRCGGSFVDRSAPQNKRFCSDPCRKRHWETDMSKRAICPDCGRPLNHKAQSVGTVYCKACWIVRENSQTAERGRQIQQWWAEGLTTTEIGARLGGWSNQHVAVEMWRLRAKGFDIPHRRTPAQVQRISDGWAKVRNR